MLEGLLTGLSTAFTFTNIMMVVGGCLIGTFIGMLPGLGPMSIIAIMIPVAITIGDPSAALIRVLPPPLPRPSTATRWPARGRRARP